VYRYQEKYLGNFINFEADLRNLVIVQKEIGQFLPVEFKSRFIQDLQHKGEQ